MTEDEARQKWCPYSQVVGPGPIFFNRVTADEYSTSKPPLACMCIASDCMAWREKKEILSSSEVANKYVSRAAAESAGYEYQELEPAGYRLVRVNGFCGLAGKPKS